MSLELKSNLQPAVSARRSRIPVSVTHEGHSAVVLLAEMDPSLAQDWEASRNTAFWNEVPDDGISANAVVMVSPGALPKLANGTVDSRSVVAEFARRRGYLREELQAWVVNRLCEVLYFAPSEFDATQDWARHGVDSAVALELVADLEDRLGARLPQTLAECRNPGELVSSVTARLLEGGDGLPWWRSPWVTAGHL
jgi:acyl carrier protein